MPVKQWFQQWQPMQLYVILSFTVLFFIAELILSHLTHSLTLLMDAYLTLCNIIALSGCLMTIKHGKNLDKCNKTTTEELEEKKDQSSECVAQDKEDMKKSVTADYQEKKLKNTFGWARIDVLTLVICCVFLASLIFSLLVEAIQTLVHIDHTDEMHQPIMVGSMGVLGLILNAVCYFLIGGYTFHQGSFLYVTESGDVVLDKVVTNDSITKGERRLSRTRSMPSPNTQRQRQSFREIIRDTICCIIVIICAVVIYMTEADVAKFVDPMFAILSSVIVLVLSFPYMKASCLILLQTIPASMDIDTLKKHLLEHFPEILNVHDLHVWQLTASKVISTVHIIFQNPKVYKKIHNEIKEFFNDYGINHVTIQPEFYPKAISMESVVSQTACCLMKCQGEACKSNHCCPELQQDINPNQLFSKASSLEVVTEENSSVTLKSVKVDRMELPETTNTKMEKVSEKIDRMVDGEIVANEEQPKEESSQEAIEENVLVKRN